MPQSLVDIDDDVLIHIFSFLSIREILTMRQVSSRLKSISNLQIVWQRACTTHVISQGFPFPELNLETLDASELESRTRRASRLGKFWLTPSAEPSELSSFSASSGMSISEVRLLRSHPGWLVTVSKGIWSVVTCWDVACVGTTRPRKIAEYSPRGSVFTGIAINSVATSEANLAVSFNINRGAPRLDILTLRTQGSDVPVALECIRTIDAIGSSFKVMSLQGDLVAISDDVNETHIINWRTGDMAVLWGSNEPSEHNFQHNRCLEVVLAPDCILVTRARTFEAYPMPRLRPSGEINSPCSPIAQHHFGWIDGTAIGLPSSRLPVKHPISVILRTESDDPWSVERHTLDLYHLHRSTLLDTDQAADNDACDQRPRFTFPPVHHSSWPSARGHLRCTDIRLGPQGTAVWIQPRPTRGSDLTAFDVHMSDAQGWGPAPLTGAHIRKPETLVAAVLPGPLRSCHEGELAGTQGVVRTLAAMDETSGNWTSVDYDEARGLIVMGDTHGRVSLLSLVHD